MTPRISLDVARPGGFFVVDTISTPLYSGWRLRVYFLKFDGRQYQNRGENDCITYFENGASMFPPVSPVHLQEGLRTFAAAYKRKAMAFIKVQKNAFGVA